MPFIIEKAKDPLYKEGMEIGIEEGIEKGIEQGIEKGAQQERIALTKSLLKLGVDIKIIKEATGFSEEEITKIKNSFLNSETDKT